MKQSTILVVFILGILSANAQTDTAYQNSMKSWYASRDKALLSPTGWLNLAGLFWLHPGSNSFGNFAAADIAPTQEGFPEKAGVFTLNENGTVEWTSEKGITVTLNDKPVDRILVFHPDSLRQPTLAIGRFRFTIIKREDRIGIRFRDLESPVVKNYHGIDRFPLDPSWKCNASLEPTFGRQIMITNVLGQTAPQPSPGKLVFTVAGKTYKLDAIDEGGDELFIIFGDETSGTTTYPSGRFVYVKKPGADGKTILNFNKSINPPCAFTEFATCPLPPRQNILPIAVTAGEKNFGKH